MASTPSGTVTQYGLNGGQALYTDTGSYGTVSSRVLTVYDFNGNVLETFTMGASLTQIYTYTADAWFHFQCVVTDNVSGSPWITDVYWVSQGFYWQTYQLVYNASNCGCVNNNLNLVISQLALADALRANLAGLEGAAQANRAIIAANVYVNQSAVIQLV